MLDRFLGALIDFVLHHRLLVILVVALGMVGGMYAAVRVPIDAVPDITNIQVQINTTAPALSPLEVERQITFPIEVAMAGLPGLAQVRSTSKFGLSQVTAVFKDDVDIYFARQQVAERLAKARDDIPAGIGHPEMGPISTGLGEIFQYTVDGAGRDLTELRTIEDWVVRPQLRTVAGVAEVNAFGGFEKQYQVLVRPEALVKHGLTLRQVFEAVAANNVNKGGGTIVKGAEQYVIRGVGMIQNIDQIRDIVLAASHEGVPVRVRNVADVEVGAAIRQGAITKDGDGERVAGIVMMLMGSNSRVVIEDVKASVKALSKTLPEGVSLNAFYDRSELIERTIHTAGKNLVEGAILVILVLLFLLGNFRAAMIVALAIPFSMLAALSGMVQFGIAATLMSLGAIDFGLIVDSSVILVENIVRHLGEGLAGRSRLDVIRDAAMEVRMPTMFGELIIVVVYLPILTLQGVEGKLFRPMALTVILALAGSFVLSLTLMPVLASLLLREGKDGGAKKEEHDTLLIRWAKRGYAPLLAWCQRHRGLVIGAAALAVAAAAVTFPFLGSEFVPKLDENAFALEMRHAPGISLDEANRLNGLMERRIRERFPDEVATVLSKTGRAEVATDPMGPNSTDFTILLHPREHWKKAASRDELINLIDAELGTFLGVSYEFSQPIEMRMNELIAGVRSDLAIKIFGDDMAVLRKKADEVAAAVSRIPGARGFRTQQVAGLPMLQIVVEPDRLARFGINAADVMETVEAFAGLQATEVLEGNRRFPLVVRFPAAAQRDRDAIASVLVSAPGGERVPLGSLCRIEEIEGPAEISHEKSSRLILVEGNVRGRDIGSFVDEVQGLFDRTVKLPDGTWVELGGQFENLDRARKRLMIVVPIALLLIFILLYSSLGSVREALLIYTGVPLAAVGGVFALLVRGMPFSISAGVGFIALSGVAVLNGLVMISHINKLRNDGEPLPEAIRDGALVRLRPVLMTALVASLGFIPMAVSTSAGAEVQRPLATVVIGGLVTSTLLTLLVLPLLYGIFVRDEPPPPAVESETSPS